MRTPLSPPLPPGFTLRDALDTDAASLIDLIGGCFAEYPGCVMDVDGELPELRAIATYFHKHDGRFWVATSDGVVVACGGFCPSDGPAVHELRKLYVAAPARRNGIAGALTDRIESEARRLGAREMELWSDTRFETAHRFYEKRGYVRGPHTRELHDKSDTVEFYFRKTL